MRMYEAINLVDADSGQQIQERRYCEYSAVPGAAPRIVSVEWWGLMGITVRENGVPVGQKPVPFKIDATNRAEAFANLESSMHAAAEGAKAQVDAEIKQAQRKQTPKLVIASAAGNVV